MSRFSNRKRGKGGGGGPKTMRKQRVRARPAGENSRLERGAREGDIVSLY